MIKKLLRSNKGQLHLTTDDALFKQAKESYENRYKKTEERGYTNDHAGLCWPIMISRSYRRQWMLGGS